MAEEQPAYTVEIEETTAPVAAAETLVVTAAVENAGEDAGTGTVELRDFDDEQADESDDLELDAGERERVELEWTPSAGAVGSGEITVATPSDSATVSVTVEDVPATFEVEITSADEHVSVGGRATIVAEITNTGTLEGSKAIELLIDDKRIEARTLSLAGGESESVEFTRRIEDEHAPELSVTVSTSADSAETTVEIIEGTVTPLRTFKSKSGMGVFGWLIFAGMLILLLPLVPLLAVLKLLDVLSDRVGAAP
jgi:hypothetical protein